MRNPKALCLHCNYRKPSSGKRGLCQKCYVDPNIRKYYPKQANQYRLVAPEESEYDPTEEQLEAMIQEMLPTMPGGKPEGCQAYLKRIQWNLPVFRDERRRFGLVKRHKGD